MATSNRGGRGGRGNKQAAQVFGNRGGQAGGSSSGAGRGGPAQSGGSGQRGRGGQGFQAIKFGNYDPIMVSTDPNATTSLPQQQPPLPPAAPQAPAKRPTLIGDPRVAVPDLERLFGKATLKGQGKYEPSTSTSTYRPFSVEPSDDLSQSGGPKDKEPAEKASEPGHPSVTGGSSDLADVHSEHTDPVVRGPAELTGEELPEYVPPVPLSKPLHGVPGILMQARPLTAEQVEVAGERIDIQIKDLKAKMATFTEASSFEEFCGNEKVKTDSWRAKAQRDCFAKGYLIRILAERANDAAKWWAKANQPQVAQFWGRNATSLINAYKAFESRGMMMFDMRRAVAWQYLYQRQARKPALAEYPAPSGGLLVWSRDRDQGLIIVGQYQSEDSHHRRETLLDQLGVKNSCPDFIAQDEAQCNQLREQWGANLRVNEILELPEVVDLLHEQDWEPPSGGLLINANDLDFDSAISVLSILMEAYALKEVGAMGSRTVLKHHAGLRSHVDLASSGLLLTGVRGLLASLCTQLLYSFGTTELRFYQEQIETLPGNLYNMHLIGQQHLFTLCNLFRDLLLDVADYAKNRVESDGLQIIVVLIDGIEFLEVNEEEFMFVIDFFRALCDEATFGDLRTVLRFKYVLLNPRDTKLLHRPYPSEKMVLLNCV